jgi:hypothetical protein
MIASNTLFPGQAGLRVQVSIASIGHSGSTLLGILLNQHEDITALGELKNLAVLSRDAARNCACGIPLADCPFWRAVERQLQEDLEDTGICLRDFAPQAATKGTYYYIPTLAEIFLVLGNRRSWRLAGRLLPSVRDEVEFGRKATAIYGAIARALGTPVVVDSPGTARYMKIAHMANPGLFRAIHIVRDGRGWTCSRMRRESVSMDNAARLWRRRHWHLQLAMRTVPAERVLTIQYEQLCQHPESVMGQVTRFLRIRPYGHQFELRKESFHGVGGNPMRFRYGETRIALDESWRHKLSTADLHVFDEIAGPLNRRLGFTDLPERGRHSIPAGEPMAAGATGGVPESGRRRNLPALLSHLRRFAAGKQMETSPR